MHKCIFAIIAMSFTLGVASAQPKKLTSNNKESSISYRLVHPLHEIEATSRDVLFIATIDSVSKNIGTVSARVDVTTFDSGNSNRDSHAMEVVDALTYPEVEFKSTSVMSHGDSLNVNGSLTFHGLTRAINAVTIQRRSSDTLFVNGSFNISLTSFQIDRPSLLMIPVQDTLRFTLMAVFPLR